METFIEQLDSFGFFVKTFLEASSVVLIALGVIVSFFKSIKYKLKSGSRVPLHIYFRLRFGTYLLVALEFQLAADIVTSVLSPTYENLIQLGIISLIRTFLNYFLTKEIKEETEEEERLKAAD